MGKFRKHLRGPLVQLRQGFTLVEMAIVLLVMGVVLAVITSLISSIPNLKSTETEAETLAGNFQRARNTALFTNSTFYLEFNLDENTYRGYLIERVDGEAREKEKFDHSLASSNGLVAISVGLSGRVETGKVRITFLPDGSAEQVAVYLGEPPLASQTVIMNRYGGTTKILKGEEPLQLEKQWSENLESF
ncbi:MAG: prepilin-type N-terminal cleavage/methylation domain-containing protein [Leptospiraceae bacterium]|nr:prepilin-type N-terminal cleavage/methylation domain-containing protein [Leptospiraceae bacterium]MCB1170114.1 prepilin-type N-terminal cleavage/methylation domain-containing protein [Leptospiraceae bacterium]